MEVKEGGAVLPSVQMSINLSIHLQGKLLQGTNLEVYFIYFTYFFTYHIHSNLFNYFFYKFLLFVSLFVFVWRRVEAQGWLQWWAVGLCARPSEGAGICRLLDGGERCRSVTPANANLGQGYWDSGSIHHCGSLETQTGGKATEVAGGGKKASKNLMHSAERSCHTWLWKIIPDACSAKMEL